MKKLIPFVLCAAMLLAGCGSTADTEATSSEAASVAFGVRRHVRGNVRARRRQHGQRSPGRGSADRQPGKRRSRAGRSQPHRQPPRADDFSVENELMLTMDNLVAYKGDVTNDQADCGLGVCGAGQGRQSR